MCRDAASGVMDKYLIDEIKSQFIEGIEFIPEFPRLAFRTIVGRVFVVFLWSKSLPKWKVNDLLYNHVISSKVGRISI